MREAKMKFKVSLGPHAHLTSYSRCVPSAIAKGAGKCLSIMTALPLLCMVVRRDMFPGAACNLYTRLHCTS